MDLQLTPKTKRPKGESCCEPLVFPSVNREGAERVAQLAKAIGDPIRVQLLDVLRKHAGEVCVCELVPLFDVAQPTVSHHLRVLREAGLVGAHKRGLWAYYHVVPGAVDELAAWLGPAAPARAATEGSEWARDASASTDSAAWDDSSSRTPSEACRR